MLTCTLDLMNLLRVSDCQVPKVHVLNCKLLGVIFRSYMYVCEG